MTDLFSKHFLLSQTYHQETVNYHKNAEKSFNYAENNQHLVNIEVFERDDNSYYILLSYSKNSKKISKENWNPMLDYFGGKVIVQDVKGIKTIIINPLRKIWDWGGHLPYPKQLIVSRLWTGVSIHATIINVSGRLEWFVTSKHSFLDKESIFAKSLLPRITPQLENITFCFQLIEHESTLNGETELARGFKGMYLVQAWRNSDLNFLSYDELLNINTCMGNEIHLSEQRLMSNYELERLIGKYSKPETRDDIRKGFVIFTPDGKFYKIQTRPWKKFSKFPIVNEKNIKKFMYELCSSTKRNNLLNGRETVIEEIKQFYPHLYDESLGYKIVRTSEIMKLEYLVNRIIQSILRILDLVKSGLPEKEMFSKQEIIDKIKTKDIERKTTVFLNIGFMNERETKETFIQNMESSPNFLLFSLVSLDDDKV